MKEPWEKLEAYVNNRLKEIYPNQRLTAGSGNKNGDLDSRGGAFMASCKMTSITNNINIKAKDIKEARDVAFTYGKEWLMIHEAGNNKVVSLDFDVFIDILKGEFK